MEKYLGQKREDKLPREEEFVILLEDGTMNLCNTQTKALTMKKKNMNQYLKEKRNQKNQ